MSVCRGICIAPQNIAPISPGRYIRQNIKYAEKSKLYKFSLVSCICCINWPVITHCYPADSYISSKTWEKDMRVVCGHYNRRQTPNHFHILLCFKISTYAVDGGKDKNTITKHELCLLWIFCFYTADADHLVNWLVQDRNHATVWRRMRWIILLLDKGYLKNTN